MKRIIPFIAIVLCVLQGIAFAQEPIKLPTGSSHNFIIISDHGRNGYYNQKEVADMMARVATQSSIRFYVTAGDNFQINGPQSVHDHLWVLSFENIYTHPSAFFDWYPALGNHDHGGNVQAQIDYSNISRRWNMPSNYYTFEKTRSDISLRLVILDTQPLFLALSGAQTNFTVEEAKQQLAWADSVLSVASEDWVIVVGHHPVYSAHPSRGNTEALVEHLNPILKKHNVDFYVGGHDHIFQHMRDPNSQVDYFVNTAGSEVRPATSNEMTVFAASSPGFSIVGATKTELSIYFIDIDGNPIYKYSRQKNKDSIPGRSSR
jgi:hypothetical protein